MKHYNKAYLFYLYKHFSKNTLWVTMIIISLKKTSHTFG